MFWDMVKLLVVLGILLISIVYVIKYGLVKLQPDYYQKKGALMVVERLPLSQKSGLYLVRAAESYYLLGVSAENITMLAEIDKEEALSSLLSQESEEFKGFLSRSMRGRGTGEKASLMQKIQTLVNQKLHGGDSDEE